MTRRVEYCVQDQRHTQLFDLENDPDELKNLAGDPNHKDILQALQKRLQEDRVRLNDGNTPYEFADEQGKYFWSRYEAGLTTSP
jgi:hypothetical protein